ncbi:MAG: hypothetical protein OXI84_09820 [bacterium]|nr:hypothetical protein [bacterium]
MNLRRFFRLLLDVIRILLGKNRRPPVGSVDDSLARTAKDAVHLGGPRGYGFSPTSKVYEHIEKGHKNYAKSFERKG